MSQNDMVIANQTAPNFRADLNSALQALASTSSGSSAPATTYANMLWYDTSSNILKMRTEADDAWIEIGTLDQSANIFVPAGLTNLTQVQVEDDASTVFGQVSGERLAQAFADQEQQVGVAQTWQDVSGSRAANTSYQNTTGKPIMVAVSGDPSSTVYFQVSVDNVTFVDVSTFSSVVGPDGFGPTIVPDTHYYKLSGSVSLLSWAELR